jgi:hypothetical protein
MSKRLIVIFHAATLVLILVLTSAIASTPEPSLLCVDRIEDGYAVIAAEDGQCFTVPASVFCIELNEGQVLILTAISDPEARKLREQSLKAMVEELAGDVD